MKKSIGLIIFFFALLFVVPNVVFAHPYFNDSEEAPFNRVMRCHRRELQDDSYEWYYNHLSSEDQQLVDTKFVELLDDTDFNALDSSEQADALRDIKEQLVSFILEMEFTLRERR